MENIKSTEVFVSNQCPHCRKVIEEISNNPDKYEGVELLDISEDLENLKRFLKYRDDLEGYSEIRATGEIGVPSRVKDGVEVDFFEEA